MTHLRTDQLPSIDVRKLLTVMNKAQCKAIDLKWGSSSAPSLQVRLVFADGAMVMTLQRPHAPSITKWLNLDQTDCHFGGMRLWWVCPIRGCEARVALLYVRGAVVGCRRCLSLRYRSQSESPSARAFRALERTRRSLGWQPGALNGEGPRPTGMHRDRFSEVCRRYASQLERVLDHIGRRLDCTERLGLELRNVTGAVTGQLINQKQEES